MERSLARRGQRARPATTAVGHDLLQRTMGSRPPRWSSSSRGTKPRAGLRASW